MAQTKRAIRVYRKQRIRKKIFGTADKPRLSVYRSLRHVYAQLVDDLSGKTLAEANSLKLGAKSGNMIVAKEVGKVIADKAKELKVQNVSFDRNGFIYHGVIKGLADAAREAGLKF